MSLHRHRCSRPRGEFSTETRPVITKHKVGLNHHGDPVHLSQTDVLPELQLHQVLLPVDDLNATVRKHLTDIPGTKPTFAPLVKKVFCCLLIVLEVPPGYCGPPQL